MGTGLGLSMVQGIVRQSGGYIQVARAPGTGASFRILLPAIEEMSASKETSGAKGVSHEAPRAAGETVLLVEDEAPVRRYVREILERAGYRVLEAASGPEALTLARDVPHEFLEKGMPDGIAREASNFFFMYRGGKGRLPHPSEWTSRERMRGMKFISPKIHGILDIAVILVLFVAPSVLDFPNEAATVSYILGAAYVLLVLFTAYPFGLAKVIPFTTHGTLELVLSPFLVAMPWLAGFAEHEPARYFYIVAGVALFAVWLTTDYKAADLVYGKRGPTIKAGSARTA